jgi:hypothetical protein
MRKKEQNNLYFVAEQKESKHYTFKAITHCEVKNLDAVKKSTKYTIDNKFTVIAQQLRDEKMTLSISEKYFWF